MNLVITRMGILKKLDNISIEQFKKYWLEVHAPIAAKIPNLLKYHQNHVVNSAQLGIEYRRSSHIVDGFSQLWFSNLEDMQEGFSSEIVELIDKDEKKFIGQLSLVTVKQNIVIPVINDKPLIKRMSLLKRRPDVDKKTFQYEWAEVHSEYLKAMPNVKGYIQNHIISNDDMRKTSNLLIDSKIDGIVELWFEDVKSLEEAFGSENGQKTMAHASTFIEEISTFLVETHEIID
ncbi:EthD family reductase [Ureibacillus massiliensis]|uniref:EthD domain-containing protein n=1 Tax=Ureibacillus massiliensis TaxID=292806 RepID=UPI000A03B665|nr:EthD family reductase [Ureibacillus massiliensis]